MSLLQCLRSYAVSREFNLGSAAGDFLKLNYFYTFWFPVSLQNIIEKSTKIVTAFLETILEFVVSFEVSVYC